LVNAFQHLVIHGKHVKEFKAKMKSALFMPGLTLSFFVIIMSSFFVFIVPRFESFFKSFKAPLPKITYLVLSISSFIRSSSLIYLIPFILFFYTIFKFFKLAYFRDIRDWFLFHIPGIKGISLMIFRLRFLQILSLSLGSGMHLLGCLNLSYNIMKSNYIKKVIREIIVNIENGLNLSSTINKSVLDDLETIALIKIGESSGNLDQMI
jgi:type II secretory pathway component PulF